MPNHQEQPTPAASPSIGADERRGLTGGGAAHAHSFLRDQKQQTLAGKRGKGGNKGGSRHGSKADLTAEEEDGSTEDVAARGKGKDKGKVKVKRPTAVSPDSDAGACSDEAIPAALPPVWCRRKSLRCRSSSRERGAKTTSEWEQGGGVVDSVGCDGPQRWWASF
jgi:hypothetical protein